jgi:tetratricopeptide (TPR) repeat protein
MSDLPRLDDLRRRVQMDPASIAFAQLAEECRRAGLHAEAVSICQAGLTRHPDYTSARVTLGRALIELDRLDDGQAELETVLRQAPENLSALRGLAQIHLRRGSSGAALAQYRRALDLAPNDPELNRTVTELSGRSAAGGQAVNASGDADRGRSDRIVVQLERWLEAIHVARASRDA